MSKHVSPSSAPEKIFAGKKLKILTVVFGLSRGGTERGACYLAQGYLELGHDSRVFVTERLGIRADYLHAKGVKVYEGWNHEHLDQIFEWSPDVLHIHSLGITLAEVELLKSSSRYSEPLIVETNVFSVPSPWEPWLAKSYQLSEWGLFDYVRRGGNPSKAAIVPYPVPPDWAHNPEAKSSREKFGIPKDALVVGRVGQPSPRKWSRRYEKALRELSAKRTVVFIAVGAPESVLERVAKIEKLKTVAISNVDNDRDLQEIYGLFDVMLHIADMGESFGYSLIEAGLHSIPVVTLASPWADNAQCEVVINGVTGFVVSRTRNLCGAVEIVARSNFGGNKISESVTERFGYTRVADLAISQAFSGETLRSKISKPRYEALDRSILSDLFWPWVPRRIAWLLRGDFRWEELKNWREWIPRVTKI